MLKNNIALLRFEKNMTQEDLASLIGIRRETIARLEKGLYNPSLKIAMDIAKVFNKTVEEIFEFVDE